MKPDVGYLAVSQPFHLLQGGGDVPVGNGVQATEMSPCHAKPADGLNNGFWHSPYPKKILQASSLFFFKSTQLRQLNCSDPQHTHHMKLVADIRLSSPLVACYPAI